MDGVFKHVQSRFQLLSVDFTLYLGINITVGRLSSCGDYRRVMGHGLTGMKENKQKCSMPPVWVLEGGGAVRPEGEELLTDDKAAVYRSVVGTCLYCIELGASRREGGGDTAHGQADRDSRGTVELGLSMPRSTDRRGSF